MARDDRDLTRTGAPKGGGQSARAKMLAAAINAFSQGVAYYHAGIDTLRSKSMDRDSYNSGDRFNRIDWTCNDNYFGTGLPIQDKNGDNWDQMRPLLADTGIRPVAGDIAWTRDAFRDLLKIRYSSTLFSAAHGRRDQVAAALPQHRLGPAAHGAGRPPERQRLCRRRLQGSAVPGERGQAAAKPDHRRPRGQVLRAAPGAQRCGGADKRAATATYAAATGAFTVPARTAVVFVVN